jgi:cytochrome b561
MTRPAAKPHHQHTPAEVGYSRLQIALHWLAALVILQQFVFEDAISGAWRATRQGLAVAFDPMILAHVAGGGLVLLLVLWRLYLRRGAAVPAAVTGGGAQEMVARLTHLGLYALMVLMPVSGAVAWFLGVGLAAEAHEVLKVALLALIALHVAGGLYHQFVLKDGLLNRMRRPLR